MVRILNYELRYSNKTSLNLTLSECFRLLEDQEFSKKEMDSLILDLKFKKHNITYLITKKNVTT